MKTTERVGKVVAIAQVDETSEVMLIGHYGKIIRMDSTTIRESGPQRPRRPSPEHGTLATA